MITPILLAALVTDTKIDLTPLVRRAEDAARITRTLRCGIRIIGYTFVGEPGQVIVYDGERYTLDERGEVSVVSDGGLERARLGTRAVTLAGELDQFSFVRVPVSEGRRLERK